VGDTSELMDALTAQRRTNTDLETELAPQRATEARELDALRTRHAELQARITTATKQLEDAGQRTVALQAELQRLEQGLTAARRATARLIEPVVATFALMLALFGWGFSGPGDFKWQALAGALAFGVTWFVSRGGRG
jgi:chromosome segregation ATPase